MGQSHSGRERQLKKTKGGRRMILVVEARFLAVSKAGTRRFRHADEDLRLKMLLLHTLIQDLPEFDEILLLIPTTRMVLNP